MTKSNTRATADVAHVVGRKNLIINGGFDVWQRGTSFTPAEVYGYSADRTRLSSGSTVNITKESATIEGNVVNTLKHSITSTGVGWNTRYNQRIEEFDYFKNKTFTLSFWVKSSRTHALSSSQIYFGGGGINTLDLYADYNMGDVTPTWTKKVITFSVGDLSTATGTYVDLVIGITSDGAAIDIEYAQMQLELGSVATEFEHRSYGEELALCERYYEKGLGYGAHWGFRTTKRVTPSMSVPTYATNYVDIGGFRLTTTGSSYYYFADAEL